ncbi:hypothetical protein [Parapedobacter lycopersici]|uniref:hypothetical protein n=1 Tax=Parapedobacter lycopersici TaxID=1864939 RepID=UPI00214DAD65|nr:hypothetical protein [Parapedobacter lycopersici]
MIGRWLILLLISTKAYTQTYTGTRHQAMGGTGTALQEIYSLTANPAGLTRLDQVVVHVAYRQHFLSTEITGQTALLGIPTRLGNMGVRIHRYGLQDAYEALHGGVVYAKPLGPKLALAISVNFHQLRIPAYRVDRSFSADAGLQYHIREDLVVGIHYQNIGNMGYERVYGVVPSTLRIGVGYQLGKVILTSDAVYDLTRTLDGRAGLEYALTAALWLRGGFSLYPLQQYAGFGLAWDHMVVDVATTFHPRLGISPQMGISYAF